MIILSILKIIGIVLACIVGLILLLVLLILLVPIRYRFSGEGMNADIEAEGKASWLFGLITASIGYAQKKLPFRVSAFGIPVKKGDLLNQKEDHTPEPPLEYTQEHPQEYSPEHPEKKQAEELLPKTEPEVTQDKTQIKDNKVEKKEEAKKEDLSDRIERFFDNLSEKYNALINKKDQVEAILTSKVTGRAIKKVKEQLFHILNHIKPKKIAGNLNFGLEDPANTAIIYGTIDVLAIAMSEGKLIITPEFYQKGISLDMVMQGRILIGYLLVCALRVILNKDVRRVVRVIRRMI